MKEVRDVGKEGSGKRNQAIKEKFDRDYWDKLSERFKKLNFKMPNLNKNQAFKVKKGNMIPNKVGSARGLHYAKEHASFFKAIKSMVKKTPKETNFYALPGVPKEMKSMFSNYVLPEIEKTNRNKPAVINGAKIVCCQIAK